MLGNTNEDEVRFIAKCNLGVHVKCSPQTQQQIICFRCSRSQSIIDQHEMTKEKNVAISLQKLPAGEVGQYVLVKVSDVDKGRLASGNAKIN